MFLCQGGQGSSGTQLLGNANFGQRLLKLTMGLSKVSPDLLSCAAQRQRFFQFRLDYTDELTHSFNEKQNYF